MENSSEAPRGLHSLLQPSKSVKAAGKKKKKINNPFCRDLVGRNRRVEFLTLFYFKASLPSDQSPLAPDQQKTPPEPHFTDVKQTH